MTHDDKPWIDSYDEGLSAEIEIPNTSIVDRFNEIVERFPDRPAIHFLNKTISYETLMRHANCFARTMMEHGCGRGDVVAVNLPNIPQCLMAQVGGLKAGCATSGLSPLLTPGEMAYQLNDCKAKALVTLDPIFEHRLLSISDRLPHLELVISTGILDFLPKVKQVVAKVLKKVPAGRVTSIPAKRVLRFMDVLSSRFDQPPNVKVHADDPCLIQYTGGTTGLPKGTVLTHRNLIANLTQILEWVRPREGAEVAVSGFPFFHVAGLALGLVALACGATQVLIPDPRNTKHMVEEMSRYRPTILVNVPTLYMMLMEEPRFRDLDFSNLEFCLSAAAPFPVGKIMELEAVIGADRLMELYGMTETSPVITVNPRRGKKKLGTVGLPVQSTRVKLVDIETGTREVPVGQEGELIVQGPQVMQGYLNRPEETAIAIRELNGEKWLYTGDVARMDEEGYFTLVDRSKDMLNVAGYKVFSREVEEKLYEHPAIEHCAIVGVPNPHRPGTEQVKLIVQRTETYADRDKDDVKEQISDFARKHLSPYKVPKIVEFADQIPLTPVGKVDKKALRKT